MELNREKMNFISWYDDIEEKEMINQFGTGFISIKTKGRNIGGIVI